MKGLIRLSTVLVLALFIFGCSKDKNDIDRSDPAIDFKSSGICKKYL
jgi:PBP1b-binding outer membrane lipoprotein LpoB